MDTVGEHPEKSLHRGLGGVRTRTLETPEEQGKAAAIHKQRGLGESMSPEPRRGWSRGRWTAEVGIKERWV